MTSGWQIGIAGAGAIGGLIGAELARTGEEVTLIDAWEAHVAAINARGLRRAGVGGEFVVHVPALRVEEAARRREAFDLLILAVKSYDTGWIMARLRETLKPEGFVVSAQNGLNEAPLAAYLGATRVVGAVVLVGAALWEPGIVLRTEGPNELVLGELDGTLTPRLERLQTLLSAVATVRLTANIWGELWAKLVQNAMSNPIAGLSGLLIREVRELPEARALSIAAAAEGVRVGLALGYDIEPILGIPARAFLEAAAGTAPWVGERLAAQGPAVGNIRGSLPRDLIKGRRTEVDAFNGEICDRGREVGIPTPVNAAILRMIRAIEAGLLKPDRANLARLAEVVASNC